ncbi:MAG: hypothetical protein CL885_04605, partial [Dehalococcoidia bacterium]|nr:hypothetical protein [Dehalococcoidia bacterium]
KKKSILEETMLNLKKEATLQKFMLMFTPKRVADSKIDLEELLEKTHAQHAVVEFLAGEDNENFEETIEKAY